MPHQTAAGILERVLGEHEADVLAAWLAGLRASGGTGGGRIKEGELTVQAGAFLAALREAVARADGTEEVDAPAFERVRELLDEVSRSRANQGFSPRETATFVFSLKQPLFDHLRREPGADARAVAEAAWRLTRLLDGLGLHTVEVYQRSRDAVVARQQEEIAELSTPVVKLWDGVLALPLIGTLDSARTQVVMENLLNAIAAHGAAIAIIDITGVPTVDTLVAQHLLKTVAAARLMGAECIVSGIRPQIAQTMVHLGVDLNVVSKASLADAFALALRRTGRAVVAVGRAAPASPHA